MLRLITLLLLISFQLDATNLDERLDLLYPGKSSTVAAERSYVNDQLAELVRQLRYTDRIERRSVRRQIAAIEQRYRRDHLIHYATSARLGAAFREGFYSDLSASLLLALTLDEFAIPYTVRLDHGRCYLEVEMGKRSYTLQYPQRPIRSGESTRTYRREYLHLLRLVTEEPLDELSSVQADSLYRLYSLPATLQDFPALVAYTRYRRAQLAFGEGNYVQARGILREVIEGGNVQPAYMLLDRACEVQLAAISPPSPEAYTEALFDRWQARPDNEYLPRHLLQQFDELQQSYLAAEDPAAARALLTAYSDRSPDKEWCKRLQLLQSLRLLAYYQRQGETVRALHLAEALYARKPDDARFQTYVSELTLSDLRERYHNPSELVTKAEEAAERYPFLRRSDRYADIVLREAALEVRDHFAGGREERAQYALNDFRQRLHRVPGGLDRPLWTLTAFIAASNYYFADGDYSESLDYVREALDYDPASDFLLHQQELLLRYQ